MAEYAARVVELQKEVAALQEQALKKEQEGGPPVVLATYIRLTAGVASYGEWRARVLTDSLDAIEPDSGATAKSQQQIWSDLYSAKGNEAFRTLIDHASRDEDPIQLQFELLAMQEAMSFTALSRMPMAGFVGQLREHINEFERQHDYLNDKWSELIGQDERADGQISALRLRLLEDFKKGVSEVRGIAPKIEDGLHKAITGWKLSDEMSPDPATSEPVANASEMMQRLRRTLEEVTQEAMRLYDSERTVITLFGNVRQQVLDYLSRINPGTMAREFETASSGVRDAAASCPKDGQKTDAQVLAAKVITAAGDTLSEFNDAFNEFYSAFKGRFTDNVSPETVELLCEQDFFNQLWRELESLDLPGSFQQTDSDLVRCENLEFDRLTPEQQAQITEMIRSRLSGLRSELRSFDSSFMDRAKILFIGPTREMLRDILQRLPGFRK